MLVYHPFGLGSLMPALPSAVTPQTPSPHDHGRHSGSRTLGRLSSPPSAHEGPHDQAARRGLHALLDDDADRSHGRQLVSGTSLTRRRDGLYPVPGTILTHGVGFTPKIKYTFVALDRIRPYAEFAGGPFWTDLAGKIPEESSQFNFVLMAGFGVSYFLTDQAALNVGYRFNHISNAGTHYPNLGLNASLPFGGFSFFF